MNTVSTPFRCHLYAGTTVMLWGMANVVVRACAQYFYAPYLSALRYFFAAIVLLAVVIIKRIPLPALKDLPLVAFAGAMGFVIHTITLSIAVKTITAAAASLIISTTPVWTAVLALALFSERIKLLGWIAIGVNVVGVFILNTPGGMKLSVNIGLIWAFASALAMCFYNIAQRLLSTRYSALQTTAYEIIFSALVQSFFLPKAFSELYCSPPITLAAIAFLSIGSNIAGFLLWANAISSASATSETVNWMFVTPLFTILFAFIFLNEIPDSSTVIGGITIISGLILFRIERVRFLKNNIKKTD